MIKADKRSETDASDVNTVYRKTELFLLSHIWRPVIASKILSGIIGIGEHEEYSRKLLVANDPGAEEWFQTLHSD